jgi:hypothetical protein
MGLDKVLQQTAANKVLKPSFFMDGGEFLVAGTLSASQDYVPQS